MEKGKRRVRARRDRAERSIRGGFFPAVEDAAASVFVEEVQAEIAFLQFFLAGHRKAEIFDLQLLISEGRPVDGIDEMRDASHAVAECRMRDEAQEHPRNTLQLRSETGSQERNGDADFVDAPGAVLRSDQRSEAVWRRRHESLCLRAR